VAAEDKHDSERNGQGTPFIKPDDDVPGIGSSQQFEAAIAPLTTPTTSGGRTGVKGGFAIPMLMRRRSHALHL